MYSEYLAPNNEYGLLKNDALLEKYILRLADGDRDALMEIYYATKIAVYGFVLSLLKNKYDAEDIFQEVYVRLYENAGLYQSKGKPLAWILTIAKNLCYMKLRKDKDMANIDDMIEILPCKKNKNNHEDRLILEAAFKNITDEERNIIMLHLISGLKHREIAHMLKLPLSTVLSKYHRAIKKLKNILKEDIE